MTVLMLRHNHIVVITLRVMTCAMKDHHAERDDYFVS